MEDRLKKFACLVDNGSFTAAAAKLHTSQPALTTSIQKLERELKAELLVRGTRGVTVTPAGELAYKHGHTLLVMDTNLQHEMRDLQEKKQPLKLGCIDSVADLVVQDELLETLEADCSLSLTVQNSGALLASLTRGETDIVVVAMQPSLPALTEHRAMGDEKFVLVCSPETADEHKKQLRAGVLPNFLAYNQGSTTYKLVEQQLKQNDVTVEPRFYSTNPTVLLRLAVQGKGVAALPFKLVTEELQDSLMELPLKRLIKRPLVAVWQQGRKLPQSVEDFLDAVQIQLI